LLPLVCRRRSKSAAGRRKTRRPALTVPVTRISALMVPAKKRG
jgi:hypothetical protein